MSFNPQWWVWMLAGLGLAVGELTTPGGFYLIFFGASAIVIGALKLIGLDFGFLVDGVLFAALAVAGCMLFRRPLMQRFRRLAPESAIDKIIGETGTAVVEIPAGGRGKAELRGTPWDAENIGESTIAQGARCQVARIKGLTIFVRGL